MAKHPGLQYISRMQYAAERLAHAKLAHLDSSRDVRRLRSELKKAEAVDAERRDSWYRAHKVVEMLSEFTECNEDGLPLERVGERWVIPQQIVEAFPEIDSVKAQKQADAPSGDTTA